MRRSSALESALAFALAVALCATSRCAPRTPPTRETLVIAQVTSALTLDPHLHDEEGTSSVLSHFYNRLVAFGPEMELLPELAISWTNPSDTLWRFSLRRGVRFHDGRLFGAPDVVHSLRRAMALPGSKASYYLQAVKSVEAVDEGTLEISTRHPTAVLLNKLVFIDIVPRDAEAKAITRPLGTGPYRFVSGAPGGVIEGERFGDYWGPPPAFSRVRILPLLDERERTAAVAAGRADLASRVAPEHLDEPAKAAVRLLSRPGAGVTMLAFSFRETSPFRDLRVRRAVEKALNRAAFARSNASSRRGHDAAVERVDRSGLPMAQIVPPGVFGYSPDYVAPAVDLEAARRLLVEAGYVSGLDSRIVVADSIRGVAELLKAQLERVGIRLRVEALPWSAVYARWYRAEDPLILLTWTAATGDASDVFDAVLHTRTDSYGGSNTLGYSNPSLDRLIEESNRTLSSYERLARIEAAMKIVREDLPVLPIVLNKTVYAIAPGLLWSPRWDRRVRAFDVRPGSPGI